MFQLKFAQSFFKVYKSLLKKNPRLKTKIVKILKDLAKDPKTPSLKSHKVDTRKFGKRWASKVTGNLRIIWDYDKNQQLTILILSLGSHTGKHKVYK